MGIKIVLQSNIDIWWVCQDKRVFVYPSWYWSIPFYTILILGQFCLGLKILAWYVEPE